MDARIPIVAPGTPAARAGSAAASPAGMIRGSALLDEIAPMLANALAQSRNFALLRIRFGGLGDAAMRFGHVRSERLLAHLLQQAQQAMREGDRALLLGNGDLAVLLATVRDEQQALLAAARLIRQLSRPLAVESIDLEPDPAVGIALAPAHGEGADLLCRHAEAALQGAMQSTDRLLVYAPAGFDDGLEPEDLREAIRSAELDMHFQAVWDLRGDRLAGAESLARWRHATRGQIPPTLFVAVAERSGLLAEFTRWSIHASLRALAGARRVGYDLPVSINVSARAFNQRGLAEQIVDAVHLWGIPPFMVELEVTETAVLDDRDQACRVLNHLHEEGVCVAIDDFGVGSSSFTYLRDLPVDRIKIDQSYVRDILVNRRSLQLVHGMIDLGHRLGISVVAEGVETPQTLARLAELGCDFAQGFQFGRPVPIGDFLAQHLGLDSA